MRSGTTDAPLVLCYGHFDVQSPAPLELWESEPFSPEVRDGWLYARGVADDKGSSWALARAALDLAAAGELPVDVRFLLDCEEEIGGTSILDYLEETRGPAQSVRDLRHADAGRRDAGARRSPRAGRSTCTSRCERASAISTPARTAARR